MAQSHNPFDAMAEQYDAWFDAGKGRHIFSQEVACLRSLMPSTTGRWLEVGVGTGRFAVALGVAEGVDPSAAMRALAERQGIRTVDALGEILAFVDKMKEIFEPWRLAQYLETARETEPFDPDLFKPRWHPFFGEEKIEFDADEVEEMRKDDIRRCTRDLLLVERTREWLLGKTA